MGFDMISKVTLQLSCIIYILKHLAFIVGKYLHLTNCWWKIWNTLVMEVDSSLHGLTRISVYLQDGSERAQWSKKQPSMVSITAADSWSEFSLCAGFFTVYLLPRKSLQRKVSLCPLQHMGKIWKITKRLAWPWPLCKDNTNLQCSIVL